MLTKLFCGILSSFVEIYVIDLFLLFIMFCSSLYIIIYTCLLMSSVILSSGNISMETFNLSIISIMIRSVASCL